MSKFISQIKTYTGTEPLNLADAKAFLRVDHSYEDDLITALIIAARKYIENLSGKTIAAATVVETWDGFPLFPSSRTATSYSVTEDLFKIPLFTEPAESVTSVYYYDNTNADTLLDSSKYYTVLRNQRSYIQLVDGESFPSTYSRPDAVRITVTTGAAANVDENLLHAHRIALHGMYNLRGDDIVGAAYENKNLIKTLVTQTNGWFRGSAIAGEK